MMNESSTELQHNRRSSKLILDELKRRTEEKLEQDEEYNRLLTFGQSKIQERRARGRSTYKQTAKEMGLQDDLERPVRYELMVSGRTGETDEELRIRYVELTKQLIEKIIQKQSDCVVFLDKSARPVCWFVEEFWDIFAGDRPKPQFKFVNIDKTGWNPIVGTNEEVSDFSNISGSIDVGRAPEAIKKLKTIFTENKETGERTYFDNKKVLIVDEVKSSGDTLEIANQFFQNAFLKAEINVWYWMRPSVIIGRDGVPRNEESPIWYRRDTSLGRGVSDPDKITDFLSRRSKEPDFQAEKLRREIKALSNEVRKGILPIDIMF